LNKAQREVAEHLLGKEEKVIKQLEQQYRLALQDVEMTIRIMQTDEQTPSRIHRIEYQERVKAQLEGVLEALHRNQYKTINKFLQDSYTDAFVGAMYDMHKQGVPVIVPMDQNAAVKAIQLDTQLSDRKIHPNANGEHVTLYESLGVDTDNLKETIRKEITRGLASNMLPEDIARNISYLTKAPLSRAKTIARTESHRIQQASAQDARERAKARGAKVYKQWDSTLDGATRKVHRELDGQIVEIDKPFVAGTKKAMYPGDFGDPALDCNCRCIAVQRAAWALTEEELEEQKQRAETFGLGQSDVKKQQFAEFEKRFLKAAETVEKSGKKVYNSSAEMLQKNSEARKLFKYISDKRFDQLTIEARKSGAKITRGTKAVEAYLDSRKAAAVTLGDELFFRENVTACEVLEETHHFMQNLMGMNDDKPVNLRQILNEIEAKEYVINNAARYKVPRNEVELMEEHLAYYRNQLAEYEKREGK
jgi:hypothetical protein